MTFSAGNKGDFLSGEEVSDLEGEVTATITEKSITEHVSACNEIEQKKG